MNHCFYESNNGFHLKNINGAYLVTRLQILELIVHINFFLVLFAFSLMIDSKFEINFDMKLQILIFFRTQRVYNVLSRGHS